MLCRLIKFNLSHRFIITSSELFRTGLRCMSRNRAWGREAGLPPPVYRGANTGPSTVQVIVFKLGIDCFNSCNAICFHRWPRNRMLSRTESILQLTNSLRCKGGALESVPFIPTNGIKLRKLCHAQCFYCENSLMYPKYNALFAQVCVSEHVCVCWWVHRCTCI